MKTVIQRNSVSVLLAVVLALSLTLEAHAAESGRSSLAREFGQDERFELAGQAGMFLGLRLKALLSASSGFSLEAMTGGSMFARSGLFPATHGAGIRAELNLASGRNHAWRLSPGLTAYYVPASPYRSPAQPQTVSDAIGQGLAEGLLTVPTRVVLASPNVDLSYQGGRFVMGAKLGVAIALNGTSSGGKNLAGTVLPDPGIYLGLRF